MKPDPDDRTYWVWQVKHNRGWWRRFSPTEYYTATPPNQPLHINSCEIWDANTHRRWNHARCFPATTLLRRLHPHYFQTF